MSEDPSEFELVVAALSRYFVGNQSLGESLQQVAETMIEALPQTKYVGITLLVEDRLTTSVFTHPTVADIDRAQYRTGDGPCVQAYHDGQIHVIDSTREPGRWQEFRDVAADNGVLSTLSLPLMTLDGPIGALNIYAGSERAYGERDQAIAGLIASQAAFLLANARAYWDARTLSENLEQALESRATIEQAKGIIMSSVGCTADEAMELLIKQSQQQNVKLRHVAAELVRNTARQRHV